MNKLVAIPLPFWLSAVTRWFDVDVLLGGLPAFVRNNGNLLIYDRSGDLIERVRLCDTIIDHGIGLVRFPAGTSRVALSSPGQGNELRDRMCFVPASKHLIAWLDPFDFAGIAAARSTEGHPVSRKDVAHRFRMAWKQSHSLNRGQSYARWKAAHVGRFVPEQAPASLAPLTFVFAGPLETDGTRLDQLVSALKGQRDGNWRLVVPVAGDRTAKLADTDDDQRVRFLAVSQASTLADRLNLALADSDIDLVSFLEPDAIPTPDAVAMIRDVFAREPDVRFVYTDEEAVDVDGSGARGVFKPAFSRHFLMSENYIGNLATFRKSAVIAAGGVHNVGSGAELHDLHVRVLSRMDDSAIRHIPRVACTTRAVSEDARAARAQAMYASLGRLDGVERVRLLPGGGFRVDHALPEHLPKVSIIIPTRDRADLLSAALESLSERTGYSNYEIVIVDNGSVEDQTFALFERFQRLHKATRVVRDDGDFNFSRLANLGIANCDGDLICLFNNDVEVIDGAWLEEMVRLAQWPKAGIVGAKLLYPDGTLQHGGVIAMGGQGFVHWLSGVPGSAEGPLGRLRLRQNLTIVTGACLLIARPCLAAIGPLDEVHLAVNCNDVDLCLRARAAGFDVIWTPYAELIHHESASRGRKETLEGQARSDREAAYMAERWGVPTFDDPYFNPNCNLSGIDVTLAAQPRDLTARSTTKMPLQKRTD